MVWCFFPCTRFSLLVWNLLLADHMGVAASMTLSAVAVWGTGAIAFCNCLNHLIDVVLTWLCHGGVRTESARLCCIGALVFGFSVPYCCANSAAWGSRSLVPCFSFPIFKTIPSKKAQKRTFSLLAPRSGVGSWSCSTTKKHNIYWQDGRHGLLASASDLPRPLVRHCTIAPMDLRFWGTGGNLVFRCFRCFACFEPPWI